MNGYPLCRGCNKEIYDKYYLRVNETSWHEECLKCAHCNLSLVTEETCFIKKRKIYCKLDYYK
jgi:LIM homeobox transcription factor 1